MKKGPRELLAIAYNSSLQLRIAVSPEPHEIGNGIILQKLLRGTGINLG